MKLSKYPPLTPTGGGDHPFFAFWPCSAMYPRTEWGLLACTKDHTFRSQQGPCTHKEHQIPTSAEATTFGAHLWDRKVYTTEASQL